jgi:hypothetical protein
VFDNGCPRGGILLDDVFIGFPGNGIEGCVIPVEFVPKI